MWIKIAQLFLSLTILVSIHEFGHFFFAKLFRCRVEKFYLFFDFLFPFANVANFSLWKKKKGETEYGIGWFPLGGYVQIAGMVDEQMDKSIIHRAPEPWELRSKPAWQRLLVMIGGILMNLLLGFFLFWMLLWFNGKEVLPVHKLPHGLMFDSIGIQMGLRNGDYITALDGKPVTSIRRIPVEIIMNKVKTIEGIRSDGKKFSVEVSDEDRAIILRRLKKSSFAEPRFIPKVGMVDSTSYAYTARIQKDDRILAVNDVKVLFFDELKAELGRNRGQSVRLSIIRNSDTITTSCKVSEMGTIGFYPVPVDSFPVELKRYDLFGALAKGISDGWEMLVLQIKQIGVLFTVKDAHKQVGGFYTMVQQMSPVWDWEAFWAFTAFLSLALAFMNFLPIPMLDGGYILFILVELITGVKVPDKFIYYANQVGLIIVLALMIYANTDWLRD
ncbi:MAG: RIP metalloprotease RseP [Bacteroidia bacterium]|nr:RIP metalloprotease RseP [Bacteroidia bacterium]